MVSMGLQMGLEGDGRFCKRQFRWMFTVDGIIGDFSSLNCLPPEKSARPNLSFKEMNVQHLIEEVFYPAKPDWKPITVTVFDLKKDNHPVWEWIKRLYNPSQRTSKTAKNGLTTEYTTSIFNPPNLQTPENKDKLKGFIQQCSLIMVDGCGNIVENWVYEDCWPQATNFQTLDMTQTGVLMCELTIRYSRAYIVEN